MQVMGVGTTSSGSATRATDPMGSLGKDDFLKLLIAQLRNQDPFKPMEDQAFIAQLAQFNTLEQMQQLNGSITAMAARDQIAQASALLGKRVEYHSFKTGGPVEGVVSEVRLVNGLAALRIGGETVLFEQVQRIKEAAGGS